MNLSKNPKGVRHVRTRRVAVGGKLFIERTSIAVVARFKRDPRVHVYSFAFAHDADAWVKQNRKKLEYLACNVARTISPRG